MSRLARVCLAVLLLSTAASVHATEIVRVTPDTYDAYVPAGKEVDAIYGDYVLRNNEIVLVIGNPLPTRNANMTVGGVGAMIVDLTRRNAQSDQLSAYYCNSMAADRHTPEHVAIRVDGKPVEVDDDLKANGKQVTFSSATTAFSGLNVTVTYTLNEGESFIHVATKLSNPEDEAIEAELSDLIRADRSFTFGTDEQTGLFWAHDEWFRQCYGVLIDGRTVDQGGRRNSVLKMLADGSNKVTVEPDSPLTIQRKIFPGSHLLEVRGLANQLSGSEGFPVSLLVSDPAGAVAFAKVTFTKDDKVYGTGRTDALGQLSFLAPAGPYKLKVAGLGRTPCESEGTVEKATRLDVRLDGCGYVKGDITDAKGGPIPCKVAFHGVGDTPTPDFGPESGAVAVKNLHYSHNGQFDQIIQPGKYEVIVSYGPEYDAVFTEIEVARGQETVLSAQLKRALDTTGWVSSDFHSHSTPSGDNTSMQVGRVLNLLCENVEFAPCTEHQRIDTYVPHLKRLGVEHLLATCTGMELTQSLGTVNHQNAFPLIFKPRTQDGGAPLIDENPITQIERLAMWDDGSEKLVQENHPNLVQILGDRDVDGKADGGFEEMFAFMDVIEVHPPELIFKQPTKDDRGRYSRNPIYHWMQMFNLGYRIPGVVNTDAHYNYHESGWIRNWLKSSTDDPAKVDTLEMVHTSEAGHIVMSTGPFMEVNLQSAKDSKKPSGIPGDDVIAPGGEAKLHVKVQCANWLDINRVQVFLNGRQEKSLNFTRRENSDSFGNDAVKFEATLPLELKEDTHVIVAAIGEDLEIGRVMGPRWGPRPPVAVSNPIFVDIDGDGFKPNGDLLDVPLPLK